MIYEPNIYVTLGNGHALGISTDLPGTAGNLLSKEHLVLIADSGKSKESKGKITTDLGTKEEAIRALKYAIERLEKM